VLTGAGYLLRALSFLISFAIRLNIGRVVASEGKMMSQMANDTSPAKRDPASFDLSTRETSYSNTSSTSALRLV
jgi:hypothetical protein